MSDTTTIKSELNFLSRDPLYETEKPYSLRFTPPPEDDDPNSSPPAARHNLKTCKVPIEIHDARPLNPRLEEHGFALTHVPTSMGYNDFRDHDKIESVYAKELQEHLKGLFVGARRVRVIDYAVRRRHASFPVSTGEEYSNQQPATLVHTDFSHDEAISMIRTLYGKRAEEVLRNRWQIINTWRTLHGPLKDWPLAVCDARTFNLSRDAQISDAVYPTWAYENVLVHHHEGQRWFYFSDMMEGETMLFMCTGSDSASSYASNWGEEGKDGNGDGAVGPCPHASFPLAQNENGDNPVVLRESIESRAFIFYGPVGGEEGDFPEEVGTLYGDRG